MFVATIGEILAIGPYETREIAEAEAAKQFPGKPAVVLMLLLNPSFVPASQRTGHRHGATAFHTSAVIHYPLPDIQGLDTLLPGEILTGSEVQSIRDAVEAVLSDSPNLYKSFRIAMGHSNAANLRRGRFVGMKALTAKKAMRWLVEVTSSVLPHQGEQPAVKTMDVPSGERHPGIERAEAMGIDAFQLAAMTGLGEATALAILQGQPISADAAEALNAWMAKSVVPDGENGFTCL